MINLLKRSLLLLLLANSAYAIEIENSVNKLPQGTSLGFIAKNITQNKIIAQHNADIFMLPASTQKVLTALTAKLALGNSFQFSTALLTNGTIKNNILEGDLIVKFSGDPTLTSQQLFNLLNQLQKKEIKKIKGNLILDNSIFTSHDRAAGWVWNDLTMCFNAPPAAISINNNCFYVELDANQAVGQKIKFNVPSAYPVQVFGDVPIVDKKEAQFCQLDAVVQDNNRYQIKGCLAQQTKPFALSFAVQDPNAYAAAIIQRHIQRLNIEFTGAVQYSTTPQSATLFAEHLSVPLAELVKKMMKKSDNQIADALFRTVAHHHYKRPASFPLATLAMRQILRTKAGIQLGNSVIVDGSGLSRHNFIAPQTMLQVLEYIDKNEEHLQLMESFPIAGVDGTLSGRASMTTPPLQQNIKAKTGALKGVYNLAGFMTNARGEHIAFVQFINGYFTSETENKTQRGALNRFENGLYNAIYSE